MSAIKKHSGGHSLHRAPLLNVDADHCNACGRRLPPNFLRCCPACILESKNGEVTPVYQRENDYRRKAGMTDSTAAFVKGWVETHPEWETDYPLPNTTLPDAALTVNSTGFTLPAQTVTAVTTTSEPKWDAVKTTPPSDLDLDATDKPLPTHELQIKQRWMSYLTLDDVAKTLSTPRRTVTRSTIYYWISTGRLKAFREWSDDKGHYYGQWMVLESTIKAFKYASQQYHNDLYAYLPRIDKGTLLGDSQTTSMINHRTKKK